MAKASKKVKRIEVERVKDGKGKPMHKVTAHYHQSPGKSGKGFSGSMPQWNDPEDTFHTSAGAAKKHVGQLMGQMTQGPNDEPDGDEPAEAGY